MREWIKNLVDILEEEIGILEGMLALLERERKAIIEGNISELVTITKEKETLSIREKLLEEARISCLEKANRKGVTLSRLIEEAQEDEKPVLENVQKRLKQVVDRLLWENKRNSFLITKAIELNQDLIRLFSPIYSLSYRPNGNLDRAGLKGSFQARG
ncbi:MAG: flagellar protein FlgN [Deferribacteres bacterium]|nr:flagellar protein FlgN [Deferribacteres bacterium]